MKTKLQVVGVMLAIGIALAACSSNKSGTGTTAGNSSSTSTTATTTATTAAPTTSTTAGQSITITPDTGLTNNEDVTITGTGYMPSEELGVTECANKGAQTGAGDCNLGAIKVIHADSSGNVSTTFAVALGPFGQNQIVCTKSPGCLLSVAQAGVADPAQVATELLHFG
jgi:Neocarzinostatin family